MADFYERVYNPDVLSCLANLSNDEVFTPPEMANQVLDMLPDELWSDPDAKFLDPCSKTGVFLREIAKRLIRGQLPEFDERMLVIDGKRAEGEELDDDDEAFMDKLQGVLDHIFKEQLFGIGITELTSLMTRRSLYCSKGASTKYAVVRFDDDDGNIRYRNIQHTWEGRRGSEKCKYCGASKEAYDRVDALEQHAYELIHVMNPKGLFNMQFDVIIGNPPYQLGNKYDNQQRDKPIYHMFVDQAKKLNPRYLSMIIPARWFTGTWNLGDFPKTMLRDRRVRILHDYPDSSDCFPGVEIKGGVCYFLWDRDNEGDCKVFSHHLDVVSESERPLLEPGNDVFIRDNEAIEILGRIKSQKSFSDIVSPQNPFGFNTAHHGHQEKKSGDIKYIIRGREVEYIAPGSVTSHKEWIEKWKVLIPKAGEGAALPNKVLGKPFIAGPGTSCSGTYMVIGPFDNRDQCVNAIRYIQTTFFRYLVSLKKITQDTKTSTYSFVPMQDFNKEWTDEKLCEKYGITAEELDYMKRLITPMTIESSEIEV